MGVFVDALPCLGLCCKDLETRTDSVASIWNHLQVHANISVAWAGSLGD